MVLRCTIHHPVALPRHHQKPIMNYLEILGLILMTPLAVIVVAMNMAKTEARRLLKMKERAERKRWKGIE